MPRRKPVTLKDIADRLDVSTTVVSTVLNNRRSNVWVSDATRESVLAVARELGYEPRSRKEVPAPHRVKGLNVAILCLPWYNPYFGETVAELCRTLGDWGYHPFIRVSPNKIASCEDGVQLYQDGRADALVMLGSRGLPEEVAVGDAPCVVIGEVPPNHNVWQVCVDNWRGGQGVAEYLWQLGHRHVGIVMDTDSPYGVKRMRGFRSWWQDRGGSLPDAHILYVPELLNMDVELPPFLQRVQEQSGERLTALFGVDDLIAAHVMRALKVGGFQIPDEISVIGFSGSPTLTECLDPPLTTLRMPYVQLGHLAAQLLRERVEQRVATARQIFLPGELVVRRSCAPPRKLD